ncbi:ubiquitin-like-specific protease 1 [Hermetia illucens]|uniref:ubiquitin-like-specific protease 1 n=1 Tax=Hermetia illucens TaxID=343691 RepID=UPI0018CC74BD|nr:ubiquitin-like-specific protease 1 [Hermetia illucens]
MTTIHSAQEELLDHIPIKEEIVNKYRTQIILTNNKTIELEIIHNKRIIYIAEYDFENLGEIFRKYIKKGTTGIYSEIADTKCNIVQEKLRQMFSNNSTIKFIRCSHRAQDILTETEAVKQISFYHVRESLHSGIQETFHSLKNKIYYPKLLDIIHVVINQCDVCQQVKYDRKPIKPKFEFSETTSDINQIIQVDIYFIMKHTFMTVIDRFSKFGTAYYLNDRNHITIIEKLEDHFAKIGKPSKIVAGNELNAVQVKEFLESDLHITKPHSHTGIAEQAVRNYNDRYHSTIKHTPNEVQRHQVDFEKIRENLDNTKKKIITKLNEKRENYEETRTTGFIKNYKAVRHKERAKYRKAKLHNVHLSNIKRPPKFMDISEEKEDDLSENILEFTEEQESKINSALNDISQDKVLISKFHLNITRRDITTLSEGKWLNDNIINFYVNLITERSSQENPEDTPKVYASNTFFMTRLLQMGYKPVRRWTRKIDIFSYDIILIPMHVNQVHWSLAVIDFKNKSIKYYDSMGEPIPEILNALEKYLNDESIEKRNKPLDTPFIKQTISDAPQQDNSNDCGVFTCLFAENIAKNKDITLSQTNIPYLRKKILLEILEGKLMS